MKNPTVTILFITLVFLALLQSCSSKKSEIDQNPEVIKIDVDEKNRGALIVSLEDIIPLETSQNCLLGFVSKARYFDNHFYILDNYRSETFFVFGEKGDFITKTIKGKGPGEVADPFAFTIIKEDSVIFVYDQRKRTNHIYDLNLNHLRFKRLPDDYILDIDYINRDTFLVFHNAVNTNPQGVVRFIPYTLYMKGFTKKKHLGILLSNNKTVQSLYSPVSIHNNGVFFVAPWNYNVYQLVDGEERVRYSLDFGKYQFTSKELETLATPDLWYHIKEGSRGGLPYSVFKTDDFLVIITRIGDKILTYFWSNDSKKIFCLNDCMDSNLIPDCKIWGVKPDGTFYGMVDPAQLIKYQQSSGLHDGIKASEDDNPYVVFFKVVEP
ncbi:MAG: 6-bladed beta-propeller [Bacteroidales bacterium]|nr:6-bladed beta-propeller [Bacteroidales bacterium]